MSPTLSKKLRFGDAAYAIGATPKQLRNWLQRDLVQIDTPKKDGGWAEYSFFDIAILSLVKRLVDFGTDIRTASDIANKVFDMFDGRGRIHQAGELEASSLAMLWNNSRLWITRPSLNDWKLDVARLWESPQEPDAAFLSIDVERLWMAAFDRAWESATDGSPE